MSELHRKIQLSKLQKLPPMLPLGGSGKGTNDGKKGPQRGKRDFTPVSWESYFEKMSDVKVDKDTFRVYEVGVSSAGPVCFFLHGGGFSGLSWAVLSKALTGLVDCRCVAVDLRGHGDTITQQDEDLSSDVLANDVGKVIEKLFKGNAPPIILIGHSMGGAIAVHVISKNLVPSVCGLVVIDVVEGTALDALNSMQSFLRSRPLTFKSVENVIEYCVKSGQIKNLESAKVSVAGQIKRIDTNETVTSIMSHQILSDSNNSHPNVRNDAAIIEEEEGGKMAVSSFKQPPTPMVMSSANQFTWRIDLSKTEIYWKGWFQGLSQMFLSCNPPKMLLLAGVDRLDKDLTVGQMQGKFQLQVLAQCGHTVHEDKPDQVADILASFLLRNRLVEGRAGSANIIQRSTFPI